MKKIILFLILLIPVSIKGYFCDYDDYNIVRKKALNVNLMTEYEIKDDNAIFTVTIYNLMEDQYIKDVVNNKIYNYNGSNLVLELTKPGTYSFEVYSNNNYCDSSYLNKLFVEIPVYNKFYKDPLCEGIENYKYCQKWFSTSITYEQFKEEVIKYKGSPETEEIKKEEYRNIFLELYLKYWMYFLPTIIVLCLIGIFIKKRQENEFRL